MTMDPTKTIFRKSVVAYVILFVCLCLFFWFASRHFSDISDDAFISFRYAKHFAEGKGLVFNEGERVEGYTNLLWVLIMAAGYKAGFEMGPFSQMLSIGCAALLVVALVVFSQSFFGNSRSRSLSYGAPALLALNPLFWEHIGTGLETLMIALLLFLSTATYFNHDRKAAFPYLTGLLLGLGNLTRPEAVIWAGGFVAADIIQTILGRQRPSESIKVVAKYGIVLAVIALAHLAWRHTYYGDWLPNTFYVKGTTNWGWGKIHMRDFLRSSGFLPLVAVCGGLFVVRKKWAICTSILISLFLFYSFRVGGDIIFTGRFLFPSLPLIYLLIQEMARTALAVASPAQSKDFPTLVRKWGFQFLVLILFLAGAAREWKVVREEAAMSRSANSFALFYAKCIKDHTKPTDTIAVVSAGILPYYAERKTIDMLGLNDRHIARHGILDKRCFIGHQKTDVDYILDREPRVIVLPPKNPFKNLVAAEKYMYQSPRLNQLYALTDWECGEIDISVYVRRNAPLRK